MWICAHVLRVCLSVLSCQMYVQFHVDCPFHRHEKIIVAAKLLKIVAICYTLSNNQCVDS